MPKEMKFGTAVSRTTKPLVYLSDGLIVVGTRPQCQHIRPAIYYAGRAGATAILVWVGPIAYFYDAASGDCVGWETRDRVNIENGRLIIEAREQKGVGS